MFSTVIEAKRTIIKMPYINMRRKVAHYVWGLVVLTWCIAMLGAYVRLSDAGLGCPDWPGCYGYWYAPNQSEHIEKAVQLFPHAVVDTAKAWKEMAHRYAVSILGVGVIGLVCVLEWCAYRLKQRWISPLWSVWIVCWLVGQALFGMWTVTLKLMPVVVTTHLLGGMLLLVWLTVIAVRLSGKYRFHLVSSAAAWGIRCVWMLVFIQIMLGGWVSTNYAAGACGSTFPLCRGVWIPGVMRWGPAFELGHSLGYTLSGELFPAAALVAIHWMHRVGAACVTIGVLGIALYLIRCRQTKWSVLLVVGLFLQLLLGFANIHWNLPLPLAVAHNGGAAFLLVVLTALWTCFEQTDALSQVIKVKK